jgi:hypothetical protein
MVCLGADDEILSRYCILEQKNIASSGALLNPNEPRVINTPIIVDLANWALGR